MDTDTMIRKDLFSYAMKVEWEKVVETYDKHQWIYKAKITKSGDIALHLAVSDGQVKTVQQLVQLIFRPTEEAGAGAGALYIENERGNSPLRLAATLGSVKMCKCIA